MKIRLLPIVAMLSATLVPAEARADTASSPPGEPCLKNNGNPCNGNNGNLGDQGNANRDRVRIDRRPPPIELAMPAVSGRSAYVSQIGDGNSTSIVQQAPNAYARVGQEGSANVADLGQSGNGTAYAVSSQIGSGNFARMQQDGAGHNVLYVDQHGNLNWLWSNQIANGAAHNGARLVQNGDGNDMTLFQDGSDNLAILTQEGDSNGMSATQLGDGNRLVWTQEGTDLSDLEVIQNGGSARGGQLLITQTNFSGGN